ncbi:hypothetical protein SAMN05661080_04880 [Modestobacter sp. DSM 44400]|uniref:hypothetical protein n=1 Tax=Modestobacter sp. DSM 44400 TaxID=1550230 RepID=UPI00089AF51B|nr:hypothetical protein [Modestobacter sp. DSM 44400]SDY87647.1 hypothetical protein SAMN05661080_04880 [Modestobacter sp. DSM 44400]
MDTSTENLMAHNSGGSCGCGCDGSCGCGTTSPTTSVEERIAELEQAKAQIDRQLVELRG